MSDTSYILVVDDSPTQLRQIEILLEQAGFEVRAVSDGQQAMKQLEAQPAGLVITDLQMPEMTGLELVAAIKARMPSIPMILTTSQGSEEIAAQALREGATSYISKREIAASLVSLVQQVLGVNESLQSVRKVAKYVTESSFSLCLGNDESLVPSVIARLEFPMIEMELFDEGERMQIAMALDEALLNGIIHGNLEVSSELRQMDNGEPYVEMIKQRKTELPYKDRQMRVSVVATRETVTFQVSDDGPGFDTDSLLDPTDPENLEKAGGRGLLLINAFMDEVSHNEKGNEITMVKRKVVAE